MQRLHRSIVPTLIFGLLAFSTLVPTTGRSQTSPSLQHIEEQLREKFQAAEAHRQQMERLQDPAQLNVEMRRHFRMTEEILALMLEQRKLLAAQAPASDVPSATASRTPTGAQEPTRGAPGGPLRRHGKDPRQESGMGSQKGENLEQMLQRIAQHSAAMEAIQDPGLLAQEMLQHQQMIDQMLERLQAGGVRH